MSVFTCKRSGDERPHFHQIFARRWVTLGVLCLPLLITVMDSPIVNVALPTLVRQLHAARQAIVRPALTTAADTTSLSPGTFILH